MTADPYTPPPRYRQRSGALVRYAIVAALLAGGGVWAYNSYHAAPPLVANQDEEQLADSSLDTQAPMTPSAEPAAGAPDDTTPAPAPRSSSPAPVDTPAPSTTIGAPPAG